MNAIVLSILGIIIMLMPVLGILWLLNRFAWFRKVKGDTPWYKDIWKPALDHEEKKTNKWDWFIFIILVLLFIYVIDWGIIKGEITEYQIAPCPECPTGMMTLNTRTYKPSSSRQEVISWMSGFDGIDKYTDCAVINRKNWQCKYDDASGTFGFTDGQSWDDDKEAKQMGWKHVRRHEYLYIYWRNTL